MGMSVGGRPRADRRGRDGAAGARREIAHGGSKGQIHTEIRGHAGGARVGRGSELGGRARAHAGLAVRNIAPVAQCVTGLHFSHVQTSYVSSGDHRLKANPLD